ncbi:MAG: glycoside hydrolase family 2, partial [Cellulomonadaceae bacterium]|nr:glycoside hydrolase family 2 [Cellulomonadaceae bacterium]
MARIAFNHDWAYRLPQGPFAPMQGPQDPPVAVTLPHDALRDTRRTPDAPGGGATAYHPQGAFTYLKTFDVPSDWDGRLVSLEVQGAFRHAMVFVNDEFAGNRADGYTRFFVDLTPYLRFGEPNAVRIEVRSGQDSRWYSGSGLHRPVLLHVTDALRIPPDGVVVTTERVEPGMAVVDV